MTITSIKDEHVERARELLTLAGRCRYGQALAEGVEAIQWAIESGLNISYIVGDHPNLTAIPCAPGVLKKISDQPVVAVVDLPLEVERSHLKILLDDVRDPGNIGTIVRTAMAFGVYTFIGVGLEGDLWTRKAIQASRGACFRAELESYPDAESALERLKGEWLIATTPHADQLQGVMRLPPTSTVLMFGNEKRGVSDLLLAAAHARVRIPMGGEIESLNVGVAAGISLYEVKLKSTIAMLVQRIQTGLGRNLAVTSRWGRTLLDQKLQAAAKLNASQVVALMVLQCDGQSTVGKLKVDCGGVTAEQWQELQQLGLLQVVDDRVERTAAGEEVLGKVWPVVEEVERQLLKGITREERGVLEGLLERMQRNCSEAVEYE